MPQERMFLQYFYPNDKERVPKKSHKKTQKGEISSTALISDQAPKLWEAYLKQTSTEYA